MLDKGILSIIDKLIHKSYIDDLNREYHNIFVYLYPGERRGAYAEALWGRTPKNFIVPAYNYRRAGAVLMYAIHHNYKRSYTEIDKRPTTHYPPPNY